MAHTLKTRRISPETKRTNAAAPRDAAPKPAPFQDAHPTLAWIARLLARQAARDYRRLSLGCVTPDFLPILFVISLLLMALMALTRHGTGH